MWLESESSGCRVIADSTAGAWQIRARLSDVFIFKTSEPMQQAGASSCRSFRVAYGSNTTFSKLASLIRAMPSVSVHIVL